MVEPIYLFSTDGKLIKQLTKGEGEVKSIDAIDASNGIIYYAATTESPLERHLYSINIKNGATLHLTSGSGTHRSVVSPDFKYFVDFYTSIDIPNRVGLFTTKGKLVKQLVNAPNPYNGYNVTLPS